MWNSFKTKPIKEPKPEQVVLLSADQAKEIADLRQEDMVEKELSKILVSIQQQSNCGAYNCTYALNKSLSRKTVFEVKARLYSLNYKVQYIDGYGLTNYFQISWDK